MSPLPTAIRRPLRRTITNALRPLGYSLVQTKQSWEITDSTGMEEDFLPIYHQCSPFTMTGIHRMYALYSAVKYILEANIPGDIVECGVWRGGSSMVAASTLRSLGDMRRTLYLYDTYAGMSKPTEKDVSFANTSAMKSWADNRRGDSNGNDWMNVSLDEVQKNVLSTGYPASQVSFVKGKVEDTIPRVIPDQIAILRLDTDWYESTLHNLEHLFPRLASKGVLLLDDYGAWQGARLATDEYFQQHDVHMLLHRIDFTGRIGIKA